MEPYELKAQMAKGILSFPVTNFRADGALDLGAYERFVEEAISYNPAALFAAGGTGEFFSLTKAEYEEVVAATVEVSNGRIPVIAGVGYGTEIACEFAVSATRAGADGLLVLPQYLVGAEQEGILGHYLAICRSTEIGVVAYNRDNASLGAETVSKLADNCANFVGYKDGRGDIEQLTQVVNRLGERLTYIGGMPTAEIFAVPYQAAGMTTYSSAVFNFMPEYAMEFYNAVRGNDAEAVARMLREFFLPYVEIRNRKKGYAVSIVKSALRVVGKDAGPVRTPLVDLSPEDEADLEKLINKVA